MPEYTVLWAIDVEDADSPEDAARQARETMKRASDPDYIANFFYVFPGRGEALGKLDHSKRMDVDLDEIEGRV
jgi:hypothetical protein